MERLILLTTVLFSLSAFADPKIIYGDDNRIDVYASKNSALVELSSSTAAIITNKYYSQSGWTKEIQLKAATLKDAVNLCSGELFENQPTAANCSAFLVSDHHVVTAGHCVQNSCGSDLFVFDYKMENETKINMRPAADNVYKCKKVISRSLDMSDKTDYAIVELDRKVVGRRPLAFRRSGTISNGAKLAVIGHPTGLPIKIADGATVYSVSTNFFTTDLDTFGGNSGSAVFNTDTLEVEGILVRGGQDYVNDNSCRRPHRPGPDFAPAEDVSKITSVKGILEL